MMASLVEEAAQIHAQGLESNLQGGGIDEELELYQPFQKDQITLPEEVQCMAVKTLLHMCKIPFSLRLRANAENMSPSGGVPFIKVGPQIVSEFDPIVEYLDLKGISLSRELSGSQRSEMKAYMALTVNRLYSAEVYLSWCCETIANKVTKPRYGAPYPWPLNKLLPWYKQREAKKYLKVQGWLEKSQDEVYEELKMACKALSDKLDDQYYFFLDRPSELDALVFGHLYSLLTFQLIDDKMADIVNSFPTLTRFVERIQENYFIAPEMDDV
ncbi:putative metaxin-2 [Apostichopus japonicus]|uniref:Putative metaxin-2 n=1 Tax=Stichopus japonicus TaxID=307972 RepID=A0A2G8L9B6_STIJA|nr:putative metaxin-2 [Apostichopus japonicus]